MTHVHFAALAVIATACAACTAKAPPDPKPVTDGKAWSAKKSPPGMPELGEKCDGYSRDKYCIDDATLLVCVNGRFAKQNCRDCTQIDHGESVETIQVDCHATGLGAEGAACSGDSRDCDGNTLVVCDGGTFHHYQCGGGCSVDHGVQCDTSRGHVGEKCTGGLACLPDGKALLICWEGNYRVYQNCLGEDAHCGPVVRNGVETLGCNHPNLGELGQPCASRACTLDLKSVLSCDSAYHFKLEETCKKGCNPDWKGTAVCN